MMNERKYNMTQEYLNSILSYKEGRLFWKVRKGRQGAGKPAGSGNSIGINGVDFKVHRIIYTMFNGITDSIIDHINGDNTDHRIENLQPVSKSQNAMKQRRRSDNTSGRQGVSWLNGFGRWESYINVNGKKVGLGYFKNKQEAISARSAAEVKYFGKYLPVDADHRLGG